VPPPRHDEPALARVGAALVVVLAAASLLGCSGSGGAHARGAGARGGGSRAPTTPASAGGASTAPARGGPDANDYDHDGDNGNDDINWGHAAGAADFRAVSAVVKAYYAAGAAGSGARGCSLIYSLLADEIPEEYGEGNGPAGLRGTTCAVVVSELFRHRRAQFRIASASLRVLRVRVRGLRGLAFLRLPHTPIHDIPVHREHAAWRVEALIDTPLG
jgi:hypothetical protein